MKPSNVWVWTIYSIHTRAAMSTFQRSEWAYRSERGARIAVNKIARVRNLGEVNWQEIEPRLWIGRTDRGYLATVSSVYLPLAKKRPK